jgi:hypothetical protein
MRCGEILRFDNERKSRAVDLNDLLALPAKQSAQLSALQKLIRKVRPLSAKTFGIGPGQR